MSDDRPTRPARPRRDAPLPPRSEQPPRARETRDEVDATPAADDNALLRFARALPVHEGPLALAQAFCAAVNQFAPGTHVALRLRDGTHGAAAFAVATTEALVPDDDGDPLDGDLRPIFRNLDAAIVVRLESVSFRSLHLAARAPITVADLTGLADFVLPVLLAGATAEVEARNARLAADHRERIERRVLDAERKIAVADFATRLVHDLQQPLTAVAAYSGHLAGVLERLPIDPVYATRMRALDAAIAASRTLARLLLFHALPIRELPVAIDLVQLAREAAGLTRRNAERVGAEITVTATDEPCIAFGRASELTRVLINLLCNACDAIGARERLSGGRIDVALSSLPSGGSCIAVTDDGTGIAPESIERLFEPFYSTKPAGQGTGLGLAIAREIVAAHGGTLTAQSVASGGARFVIVLPRVDASPLRQ